MTIQSHHDHVEKQFSSQASEYLTSTTCIRRDLQCLAVRLADYPQVYFLIWAAEQGMPVIAQKRARWWRMTHSAHMLDVGHKLPKSGN